MNLLTLLIAGAILIPTVVVPIVVLITFRIPATPTLTPTPSGGFPADVQRFFNHNTRALEMEGFSTVADATQTNFLPNTISYIRLMVNRELEDAAMCAVMESGTGKAQKTENYVEFCTEFSYGHEICTNNSPHVSAFQPVPEKLLFQYPLISDVNQLYKRHRAKADQVTQKGSKILPSAGTELQFLSKSMVKDLERQVKTGFMAYNKSAGIFSPTIKGAFLMTYRAILGGLKKN
ncbi:MAG: hypothetical protein GY765_01965 [bacterium]|nr:hypothetical protein [bacterium]